MRKIHHVSKSVPILKAVMSVPVTVATWWIVLNPAAVKVTNDPILHLSHTHPLTHPPDYDECSSMVDDCDQICTNTEGSFSCSCRPGFLQDGPFCFREEDQLMLTAIFPTPPL